MFADVTPTAALRSALAAALRIGLILAGGFVLVLLASLVEALIPYLADSPGAPSAPIFTWWMALAVPWIGVAVELPIVGWRRSALRRILFGHADSVTCDFAYQALALSGGFDVLIRFTGLGLIAWSERVCGLDISLVQLHSLPAWLAVPTIWMVLSFTGYWEHRMLHTRWLWTLHKSHHSATEFTMLNTLRTHPLEPVLSVVANMVPLALLGFAPEHIALFGLANYFVPLFLHCNWTRTAFLERFGVCTPAGHRLHHAIAEEYHDRNFGELTNIWDRLFGTYVAPDADVDSVRIGVDALPGRHNTGNPFREIALQTVDWLTVLRHEIGGGRVAASSHEPVGVARLAHHPRL